MENDPNFHGYGHFRDQDQHQNDPLSDKSYGSSMAECRIFESFCSETQLDGGHLQPLQVFESENGSDQSASSTDFTSFRSSFDSTHAFGNNSDSTWISDETTEDPSWLASFSAPVVDTHFLQESNYDVGIANPSMTKVLFPPNHVQFPQIISPSTTFWRPYDEYLNDPVYAPQQGSEPSPNTDGKSRENSLPNSTLNSSEVPSLPTNCAIALQSRPVTKRKLQPSIFYCNIRPCNHQKAFRRKADLERHQATQHSRLYFSQCPWPDCEHKGSNGFLRRDKMLKHQDKVHGRRL